MFWLGLMLIGILYMGTIAIVMAILKVASDSDDKLLGDDQYIE